MNISILSKCFVKIFRIFALRLGQKSCFCVFVKEKIILFNKKSQKIAERSLSCRSRFFDRKTANPAKNRVLEAWKPRKQKKKHFFWKKSGESFGGIEKSCTFALAIKPERVADSNKAWSLRLSVRTWDFHSQKRGSIPLGTTKKINNRKWQTTNHLLKEFVRQRLADFTTDTTLRQCVTLFANCALQLTRQQQ